jgi:periplasmic divalent cation tolerance protein
MSAIIVLTNAPDRAVASSIATVLVERKLAACVNMLAECTSIYRWQGEIESAVEVPLLIKTRSDIYDEVEATIRRLHPYELPEIIAIAIEHGSPAFLAWIGAQTSPERN